MRNSKKKRGFLSGIVNAVMMVFTVVSSATLLFVYLGSQTNPNTFWPLAFLTLVLPFIMLLNLIFTLYWVLAWRWYFIVPLAVLMLGLGSVSTFFKPTFSKDYDNQPENKAAIKILSYNVAGFLNLQEDGKIVSVVDSTLCYLNEINADIICIQEFEANYRNPKAKIDSLLGKWAHNTTFYTHSRGDENGWGLAVYSKYPIVNSGGVQYPSNNGSMWVDVLVGKDTIHLINNHLQSMKISKYEREMFELADDDNDMERGRVKQVVSKMKDNFKLRADQADSLALKIASYGKRTVVCGDFNDTPMSYTYRTMKGDLIDAFQECGSGAVNTYRDMFGIFRIDYVFHSQDISSLDYKTLDNSLSDHNAVKVKILLNQL